MAASLSLFLCLCAGCLKLGRNPKLKWKVVFILSINTATNVECNLKKYILSVLVRKMMDRWIFDCFFTSFWDEAVGLFSGVSNISLTVDFRGVEVCI